MSIVTVTRNAQITIPKKIREALGIKEGDRVIMRIEGDKIIVEKVREDVWLDPTDFLPRDFENILRKLRSDSRIRFKRLGIVP
ncbi:MAG TPA: AbrB/MazE/SpoVT family DNA-binding domain-containing protein [Candidatus Korarchaeota archaeon]|nr:AbrB/MazE/SpoVT family DNA-binding domain-containing protein [Candidatus Korarchaeota archaeon]